MSKSEQSPSPSGAQLEILEIVQRAEHPLSAPEIWSILCQTRDVSRPTVATLLARLEAGGWVSRQGIGRQARFTAKGSHEDAKTAIAETFLDKFFSASPSSLILSLIDSGKISAEELERLREIVKPTEDEQE